MRQLDRYSSLEHYRHHLDPIWQALPPEARGTEYSPTRRGLDRAARWPRPVLVASYADYLTVAPRPVIYVEHGSGQTYPGDPRSAGHGSYAGGQALDRVLLFLAPSERVAAAWADSYPTTTVAVVGSPRLDVLTTAAADGLPDPLRVAFTWHWDCRLIPETKSALPHYAKAMPRVISELRCAGHTLDGHGHPRRRDMATTWARLKVNYQPSFEQLVARATVLVGDNSSVLYEWAALGRPVVVLNAPWYRRDVEHGLRFWSHVPGVQVDEPEQLVDAITAAAADPDAGEALRSAATGAVYAHRGEAVARSVAAILEALQ